MRGAIGAAGEVLVDQLAHSGGAENAALLGSAACVMRMSWRPYFADALCCAFI